MNQVCVTFTAADLRAAAGRDTAAEKAAGVVFELSKGKPVMRSAVGKHLGIVPEVAGKNLRKAYRMGLIKPANSRFLGWYPVTQEV